MGLFHSILSFLAVTLIAGIAQPTSAAAANNPDFPSVNCHMDFSSPAARAEVCTATDGRGLVTLTWANGEQTTVVKALFAAENDKLWRRIWVVSGNPVIDAESQLALRKEVFKYGPQLLHPRVHAVVDFIANFAPAGSSLAVFDRTFTDQLIDESNLTSFYTLICQELGKLRTAAITLGKLDMKMDFIVGAESQGCPGRCGLGCHQVFQWRKNQYTNECLVHDACATMTGQWLGQCTGYFIVAALGYLLAPDCGHTQPPSTD